MTTVKFILLGYFVIGLCILLFTRARKEMIESLKGKDGVSVPFWKIATFYLIIWSVAMIFWPIFLKSWFSKPKSLWDDLSENPLFLQEKALYDAQNSLCQEGCESDEIPGGEGEFGWDITNPIPTNTSYGSAQYLRRLRSANGERVLTQRNGSRNYEGNDHPIDIYSLSSPNGEELGEIYVSMYHKRNSGKAPKGLVLV